MTRPNDDIRTKAKRSRIKLWEVADRLGLYDGNLSRKLRHELPQEEKDKIFAIIDELARERDKEAG